IRQRHSDGHNVDGRVERVLVRAIGRGQLNYRPRRGNRVDAGQVEGCGHSACGRVDSFDDDLAAAAGITGRGDQIAVDRVGDVLNQRIIEEALDACTREDDTDVVPHIR